MSNVDDVHQSVNPLLLNVSVSNRAKITLSGVTNSENLQRVTMTTVGVTKHLFFFIGSGDNKPFSITFDGTSVTETSYEFSDWYQNFSCIALFEYSSDKGVTWKKSNIETDFSHVGNDLKYVVSSEDAVGNNYTDAALTIEIKPYS